MNQEQLTVKVFNSSSRTAKSLLGSSFHDLHTLGSIALKQQAEEINQLKHKLSEIHELVEYKEYGEDEIFEMIERIINR